MLAIFQREYDVFHRNGGKPPKLTAYYPKISAGVPDHGQYCGGISCLQGYGLSVHPMGGRYPEGRRYIRPDREKKLKRKSGSIQCSVVDVTESPVNYPQKNKKAYYSGKKMAYAETQVIVERNSLRIIDRQEAKGSEHDCKVYKDAIGNGISNSIPLDADLGYLGIEE